MIYSLFRSILELICYFYLVYLFTNKINLNINFTKFEEELILRHCITNIINRKPLSERHYSSQGVTIGVVICALNSLR